MDLSYSKEYTPHWRVLLLSFGKVTCPNAGRVRWFRKVGSSAQLLYKHLQIVLSWRQPNLISISYTSLTPQTHIRSDFDPDEPNCGACQMGDP